MVETGSYRLNKARKRDTSFKSFICALLAFLAMLILISVLLFVFRNKSKTNSSPNEAGEYDYIKGNKTQAETSTPRLISTTTTELYTTRTPTPSSSSTITSYTKTTPLPIITTHKPVITTESSYTSTESTISTTEFFSTSTELSLTTTQTDSTSTIPPVTSIPTTSRFADTGSTFTEYESTSTESTSTDISTTNTPEVTSTTPGRTSSVIPYLGEFEQRSSTSSPSSTQSVPAVPTECKDGICKRTASTMLAIMNHEDKVNRCEDSYKFICEGAAQNNDFSFLQQNFKGFVKKIKEVQQTSPKHMILFSDFYNSCYQYENSINRLNRIKFLKGTGGTSITETMTKLTLTQSNPIFDIGLNILENIFILEITLPGLSSLKTSLSGWSLIEQLKDECIDEESNKILQNVIELDKVTTGIKTCIIKKTKTYIKDFTEEMKQLMSLPDLTTLTKNIVDAATNSIDLEEILTEVQESLDAYRTTNSKKLKQIKLADLKAYDFGLDWITFFKGITTNIDFTENTIVYISEHLYKVFNKVIEKKGNLQPLLDFWYNIEFYKNTVVGKSVSNRAYYCLKTVTELMPEVSSSIIAELNIDKKDLYKDTKNLLNTLKNDFKTSLLKSGMAQESIQILEDRLLEMELTVPDNTDIDESNYPTALTSNERYQKKVAQFITWFRLKLYTLHGQEATADLLLKFFVNAFDTKPKTFYPAGTIAFQPGFMYGVSTKLPYYIKLAKLGFPLAVQIGKHFIKDDYLSPLNPREKLMYEKMEKDFDGKDLINKVKYVIENTEFEIEDTTGNHLNYEEIFADNLAFRLNTDTFINDKRLDFLPFLQNFLRNETFLIISLQGYCGQNTLADFIGNYYNGIVPVSVKFKNFVNNSEIYGQTFNCSNQIGGKQFPYITS